MQWLLKSIHRRTTLGLKAELTAHVSVRCEFGEFGPRSSVDEVLVAIQKTVEDCRSVGLSGTVSELQNHKAP